MQRVAGDPSSTRVVFVVPQFHRSSDAPIAWTSLAAEIADVQRGIDALTTRLVVAHGPRCVGTEGDSAATSAAPTIPRRARRSVGSSPPRSACATP